MPLAEGEIAMTIIELNIAGYHGTHIGPDITREAFRQNWLRGWQSLRRNAHWPIAHARRPQGVRGSVA
jgi:hypothetical protein